MKSEQCGSLRTYLITLAVGLGTLPLHAGIGITLPSTGVSNSVATLNGLVNPGGDPACAWFGWGLSPFTSSQQSAPVAVAGTGWIAVSNTMTGLTPGLVYHGAVVTSNSLGAARASCARFGAPALTLNGPAVVTNFCNATLVDPGASATFAPLAIAAGYYHSVLLKGCGVVAAWGLNNYGQTNRPAGLSNNVIALASGGYFNLALKRDSTLAGWGDNSFGQTAIPSGLSNVTAVACGYYHSLALKSDGTIAAWGQNNFGQVSIPAGLSNVVAVAGGGYFSLALKGDGTVTAWGYNADGQTNIPAGLSNVVAIAAGQSHCLALQNNGLVTAWGANGYAQSTVPAGLSNVVAIAGGLGHSLALKRDGTLTAWGYNGDGETNIPASATNVVAIAAGAYHNLALKSNGGISAWGQNVLGQTTLQTNLNVIPYIVSASPPANANGSYVLTYSATNILGGVSAAVTRTIVMAAAAAPTITLLGSNPLILTNVNRLFADPGATAFDACSNALAVTATNNVNVNFPGAYGITYTVVDGYGNAATNYRAVYVALPPAVPGDQTGGGSLKLADVQAVYASYLANNPWLTMTNVAGLGGTNVTFGLSNSLTINYTVQCSSDLVNWQPLGLAAPQYVFTDATAPGQPQRFYRLSYP
jgi:alpha-tubulin suppressor-like RCC1 family protein